MRAARTFPPLSAAVQVLLLALACAAWLVAPAQVAAQDLTARVALGATSAFVGEGIRLQIQVDGSERPEQPDLSGLDDFTVQFDGGASNSSSSVTIINGKMTRQVQYGYIFNFTLTPRTEGTLTIPPVQVTADGRVTHTNAVRINVRKPVEAENFKLRASLSRNTAYVGEPIILEIVFFYSADVRRPNLTLPALDGGQFQVYDLDEDDNADKVQELGGRRFQTMRLRKALVPMQAGTVTLPAATLSFEGEAGSEVVRDFFGRRVRQATWQRFVIPSNEETLEVRELPEAGRPAEFAGHIGDYQISATAAPLEVSVGDPITLTVSISGPPYLEHVRVPSLHLQKGLTASFKVPEEMDPGTVNGSFKVFTQTIRARNAEVAEIPPIELPYFDSEAGEYRIARSRAIPIAVKPTNVVTFDDAEGLSPVAGGASQVEGWSRGIAYNYEELDVLENQRFRFTEWLQRPATAVVLGAGPVGYGLLLALTAARRRREADPGRLRARKAAGELQRQLRNAADESAVLEAFRGYLGAKCGMASGAMTYRDVAGPLRARGVAPETLDAVKEVFDQCEAGRYAGAGASADARALGDRAMGLARELEGRLK